MPQWRKLHAKTLDSVDVAEMPDDFTRLTWHMLPLIADREGRAIDDTNWLRSKLFPLRRDVTFEMIEAAMCWYANRGMTQRYEVNGRHYFAVVNFGLYQGNTEREAASVIPEPVKQPRKSKSRPTHELVVSKSSPDVDVDVDVEEKREETQPGANPAPENAAIDPVKQLAETFEQASGIQKPTPTGKKSREKIGVLWWQPLREMVKMANGSAAETVTRAVEKMRREHLTIATPNSILKVFISLNGEQKTNSPVGNMDVEAEFQRLNAHLLKSKVAAA